MIRLLGAITGSALALATLLVVIGIPQFKAEPSDIDRTVMTLPLPTSPVEEADTDMPDKAQAATADTSVPEPASEPAAIESDEPADIEAASQAASDATVETDAQAELPNEFANQIGEPVPALEAQHWYAFWSPFRSEIAASGFVEQLQRVTGLDYRVVKVKPGVYEVAFAYSDDTDISTSLSQITAATGLQMPEY